MGVLNVTPDSFSDGGKFFDAERRHRARAGRWNVPERIYWISEAESTRPGSAGISAKEELARVLPVLQALRGG